MEYVINNNLENSKKSFTFNLVKGQKLLSKLKSYMDKNKSNIFLANNYFNTFSKSNINIHSENNDILEKYNKRNNELRDKFVNMNLLITEFYKFKN